MHKPGFLLKKTMKRLETTQRSMIRRILGIKKINKIKIIDMYKKNKNEKHHYKCLKNGNGWIARSRIER